MLRNTLPTHGALCAARQPFVDTFFMKPVFTRQNKNIEYFAKTNDAIFF